MLYIPRDFFFFVKLKAKAIVLLLRFQTIKQNKNLLELVLPPTFIT